MKEIRIGIFGLGRGRAFIKIINRAEGIRLVSVCDVNQERVEKALSVAEEGVKAFDNFDEFIDSGMDAVFLGNNFHEHAEYAIKALEKGIHVLSECTAAATLSDCVKLCEAVEKSGCTYMLAENYPYTAALLEMERLCAGGTLGELLYAEGEYNHTGDRAELERLTPGKNHWRGFLPRTYYLTHTLGPLMHITKQIPVSVSATAVHSNVLEKYDDFRHNFDAFAMMNCKTDKGMLLRFTGCAAIPTKSGYRVCGEYGSAETGRSLGKNINLVYHEWEKPEGVEKDSIYTPEFPEEDRELIGDAGHSGGDYYVIKNFVDCVKNGKQPFFDVYTSCLMSAVAIFAWRSCLNNGETYTLPNFKDSAEREKLRFDALSPFPKEDGSVDIPCAAGKRVN